MFMQPIMIVLQVIVIEQVFVTSHWSLSILDGTKCFSIEPLLTSQLPMYWTYLGMRFAQDLFLKVLVFRLSSIIENHPITQVLPL